MELITLGDATAISVPKEFLERFAPKVTALSLPHDDGGQGFLSARFPIETTACHMRFTLDSPLPCAHFVRGQHTPTVLPLERASEVADGLIARTQSNESFAIALKTADCLSVALVYERNGLCAATLFHAGWRGYCAGIQQNALHSLLEFCSEREVEPTDFFRHARVVICPAIFGFNYPCGSDVKTALEMHDAERLSHVEDFDNLRALYIKCADRSDSLRAPEKGRIYPDLQLMMTVELVALGFLAEAITIFRENTYGHAFLRSYRYACTHGLDKGARLVSHLVHQDVRTLPKNLQIS